jgi:hypothetical protein
MSRRAATRAAAVTALLATTAGMSFARAAPRAKSRVALDWRSVSDADIERCGLSRLRAGTLEQLVDDGHAVVDRGDSTVQVRVSSVAGGLHIRVESREALHEDKLALPENCDATLVLEAISRIAELVRLVSAESTSVPPAELPAVTPDAGVEPAEDPSPRGRAFQLSIDAAAKAANPSDFLLFGAGVGLDFLLLTDWQLGGRAELMGSSRHEVMVLEASAAVTAGWQPPRSFVGVQVEFGPLLHIGNSERLNATEVDAAAGAGLTLRAGIWQAQLIGYVRLRRFEHFVDGKTAFDTGQAGLILRIGAQLFDS